MASTDARHDVPTQSRHHHNEEANGGRPWSYDDEPQDFALSEADKEFFEDVTGNLGAGVCGRGMYDSSDAWGGTNPFDGPLFVVTHRLEDAPGPSSGFTFVDSLDVAMQRAMEAAGGRDVAVSGGADVIRQALAAGYVDELAISTAPFILGGGKGLFDGFEHDIDLEIQRAYTAQYATHVRYRIKR